MINVTIKLSEICNIIKSIVENDVNVKKLMSGEMFIDNSQWHSILSDETIKRIENFIESHYTHRQNRIRMLVMVIMSYISWQYGGDNSTDDLVNNRSLCCVKVNYRDMCRELRSYWWCEVEYDIDGVL